VGERIAFCIVADAMSGEPVRLRTFGEREIYSDPELWLGQVDVELPSRERVWEPVVRLHRVAMLALVDVQDRALLVRRHRLVAGRAGWELPGGLVDAGEEPLEAALRQVEDTAGYRPGRVEHLITFRPMAETVDSEHFVFAGRDPVRAGEPVVSSAMARVEWVPLGSILELIAAGEIWSSGTLVGLLRLLASSGRADSG
jgi:ADP-ribose pyrophosphatase YjhB (NUDIX family)